MSRPSYRLLVVLDEHVPDSGHRDPDLRIRVELVAEQLRYDAMHVWRQLVAGEANDGGEAERRPLTPHRGQRHAGVSQARAGLPV